MVKKHVTSTLGIAGLRYSHSLVTVLISGSEDVLTLYILPLGSLIKC